MSRYNKPLKWSSPEELEKAIESYFEACEKNKEIPKVTGLAYYLGMDRKDLCRYENYDKYDWLKRCPEDVKRAYSNTIKRAKQLIEIGYEELLFNKNSSVGAIFTLKNNYDWVDKQEVVNTNKDIKVTLEE